MFADDDPILARIRERALAFPDSDEKISHGRPAFFTKKVFAYFGGSIRCEGDWVQHPQSLVVRPDPADERALRSDSRVYVPAYLGAYGWLGIDLDNDIDWAEITELLDASYRLTAPKRSIARLDVGER